MQGLELHLDDAPLALARLRTLKLGRAELLTDAICLPFVDLQKELEQYALAGSAQLRARLRKCIKNYLARLNANPLLPLSFRLEVLDRIEKELDLFDGELTAAVLTGRLIALEMVVHACRQDASLVELVPLLAAQSVALSTRLNLLAYARYEAPHPLAVRQAHALMRLGAQAAQILADDHRALVRLREAMGMHELLRAVDFFALMPNEQPFVREIAEQHVLQGQWLPAGARASKARGAWLAGWFHQPQARPQVLERVPPPPRPADAIVVPIDEMIERLALAVGKAEAALHGDRAHLATERALRALAIGGRAILDGVSRKARAHPRRKSALRIWVQTDASKALADWISAQREFNAWLLEEAPQTPEAFGDGWLIVDRARNGLRIERVGEEPALCPKSLIGLRLRSGRVHLGFVRWLRRPKPTEAQVGVALFAHRAEGFFYQTHPEAARLPCLMWRNKKRIEALFPETHLVARSVLRLFAAEQETEGIAWRIEELIEQGGNCTIALLSPAA